MGKAARAILQAVVAGETDARRLAGLAIGRVQASPEELERALTGKVTAHHRFLLGEHLRQIEYLETAIRRESRGNCAPVYASQSARGGQWERG